MSPIRLVIVGIGKIVRDQHIPNIEKNPRFVLAGGVSPHSILEDTPMFKDLDALFASGTEFDAAAVCTPPQVRHGLARQLLLAGKHVFLEKPPGATVSEVEDLAQTAKDKGLSLFASWHSRQAPGVEPAAEWLKGRKLKEVEIVWREDVRHWHPGQEWVWKAGGLGVFDPGINALSIATRILPPFFVRKADLEFPSNCEAPIAARIDYELDGGGPMSSDFDWRQTGPQTWDIRVDTQDGGALRLSKGGTELTIDGHAVDVGPEREYGALYDRFADVVEAGELDADVRPLQQVADAFLLGRRIETEAFYDPAR
ncbi:Gfo/Idh/MocA family protein [Caulobacter sp. S45]|uniref:Gfo/Idh/MocA family protein n=1 Tax=Caulobacter sp. S45 TaxID=1641861 RepID=UPI00131E5EAC|nr:Gfo/Idh/MocA family oxidoreductase [Caulobacter sp. S45]